MTGWGGVCVAWGARVRLHVRALVAWALPPGSRWARAGARAGGGASSAAAQTRTPAHGAGAVAGAGVAWVGALRGEAGGEDVDDGAHGELAGVVAVGVARLEHGRRG